MKNRVEFIFYPRVEVFVLSQVPKGEQSYVL